MFDSVNVSEPVWYCILAAIVAIAFHVLVKRYWLAVLLAATSSSLVNLIHEVVKHGGSDRPVDWLFWLPFIFLFSWIIALPVVTVVGFPFLAYRRSRSHRIVEQGGSAD